MNSEPKGTSATAEPRPISESGGQPASPSCSSELGEHVSRPRSLAAMLSPGGSRSCTSVTGEGASPGGTLDLKADADRRPGAQPLGRERGAQRRRVSSRRLRCAGRGLADRRGRPCSDAGAEQRGGDRDPQGKGSRDIE